MNNNVNNFKKKIIACIVIDQEFFYNICIKYIDINFKYIFENLILKIQ